MFYVSFEEKYNFPELPENAVIRNRDREDRNLCISMKDNIKSSDNDFYKITKIYEINKVFYEWVEKLPSLI